MEVVFFGSSQFSLIILEGLYKQYGEYIKWVVTKPPSPSGRGLKLRSSCVEVFAQEKGLNICYFDEELAGKIKGKIFILASYGKILPPEILKKGTMTFNVHPSLIPQYRGATPIESCLLNRDKTTGVSLIEIGEKMDAGSIFYQTEYAIRREDNYLTLHNNLAKKGMSLVIQALKKVLQGDILPVREQDNMLATYSQKINKSLYRINWQQNADQVIGQIKAFAGRGYAYTYFRKKILKIIDATAVNQETDAGAGEIVAGVLNQGFIVACLSGTILVREVQLEGKKRVNGWSFFCGYCRNKGRVLFETQP